MARFINEDMLLDMLKSNMPQYDERLESLIGTAACLTGVDTDIFSENYSLRRDNLNLIKENEELLARVDKLIEENEELGNDNHKLITANEELENDNKSVTACFEAVKAHNTQLRAEASKLEGLLQTAEMERDARGEALEKTVATVFQQADKINNLEKELKNLQEKYDLEASFEVQWRTKYTETRRALRVAIEERSKFDTLYQSQLNFWKDKAEKFKTNAEEYREIIKKLRNICGAALGCDWDE